MAPSPLAWLLRLAAFFHLCTLLPAWRRHSTDASVLTRRRNGSKTP
uniref:C-X3-C motif chemokine ligand 1 n=1 Tax=Mus musculus TaxID=10090 RepID=A0A1D5RLW9_MOUSE